MFHKLNIEFLKKSLKTVCKRCFVTVRKRCLVSSPVKRFAVYPYLYCILKSVYEKTRISVKSPFFHGLTPFTDRPCGPGMLISGCDCKRSISSLDFK